MFRVKFCQKCDSQNHPVSRNKGGKGKIYMVTYFEISMKLKLLNKNKVGFGD